MNEDKRAVIYGMAIGDGYVQVRRRRKPEGYAYIARSMSIKHSIDQLQYLEHKAKRLGWAFGGRHIKVRLNTGVIGNKKYPQCRIDVSHPYLSQVHRNLYPEGKKTYTEKVLSFLNPEAIAYWYMDDGHARRNRNDDGFVSSVATNIAVECTEKEVDLIIEYFKEEHEVVFNKRYRKSSGKYYIEANTEGSHVFCGIIQPYVVPSMLYKLAHVADLRSHERGAPVGTCNKCGAVFYQKRYGGLCHPCYTQQRR